MKKSFYYCLTIILVFPFGQVSFAQTVISGKVSDKTQNKALSNAIITLNKLNTETTIGFGMSKPSGQYEIKCNANADSLTLNIKMLGYATQRLNVPNKSQTINFELEESSIELKEVKVKPDPIKKYGDTLSYAVSAFKDKNDRVIADIIRKLPGVEVSPNGQILYQGEPINKYYIEGMDLLEGRYKLANENLNVEAVTNIEILENHQPVRMLNGVVHSEKAALNIKLKKNITTTGQMSLGAGFSPLLWDVNLTPMFFTKNTQFLATYQANNVGKNNSSQLMRLTPGVYRGESGIENKQDWLGIQKLSNPAFKENRWLDNNSHIGSINILKKLKNNFELRLNGDYTNDIQQQEGYTKTIFFSSKKDSITLLENKLNKLYFNNLKTDFTLQKNSNAKYLKNSLRIKAYWDSQTGIINNQNGTLSQQVSVPFYTIANDYRDFFKVGKSLLTLNSSISFERKPQQLIVSPGQFVNLFNANKLFETLQQNIIQTGIFADNSVQFLKTLKAISFDTQVGFLVEKQDLTSDISVNNGSESRKIDGEFSNNLAWNNQKYYIYLQSRYKKKKLNINFSTPISYYIFKIEDKALNQSENLNRGTFEPRLGLNYDLNNYWTINASSSKINSFGNINQMYYGYMLTSYRDIKRSNAPLSQSVNFSNSVGLTYRNPINSTFANLIYNYSVRENNLLFINNIGLNGSIERNAIEQKNNNYAQSLNTSISKYFREVKTTVSIGTNIFKQENQQIINNNLATVIAKGISPNLRVSSSPLKWFGLEYAYKLSSFKNIVADIPKQKIIQQNHDIKLNFNPAEKWYLGINTEYYINNFNDTQNLFSDLVFRRTNVKKKIDLEATWLNIFNTKSLLSLSNGAFNYVETSYNLRPSQLVLKLRFSL
jgi:hypothetical protein